MPRVKRRRSQAQREGDGVRSAFERTIQRRQRVARVGTLTMSSRHRRRARNRMVMAPRGWARGYDNVAIMPLDRTVIGLQRTGGSRTTRRLFPETCGTFRNMTAAPCQGTGWSREVEREDTNQETTDHPAPPWPWKGLDAVLAWQGLSTVPKAQEPPRLRMVTYAHLVIVEKHPHRIHPIIPRMPPRRFRPRRGGVI